jgi:hypothetical protein
MRQTDGLNPYFVNLMDSTLYLGIKGRSGCMMLADAYIRSVEVVLK